MTRTKHRLDLLLAPVIFFGLIGLGLSCTLIALQVINPSRQILSLEHWHDYAVFFNMGARLVEFGCLGALAASLTLLCFLLWAAREMQVLTLWRRSRSERVPLGRLIVWAMQVLFLYVVASGAAYVLLWMDVASGSLFRPSHAVFVHACVVWVPALAFVACLVTAACHAPRARTDLRALGESWSGGAWSTRLAGACALLAGSLFFSLLAWDPQQFLSIARPDLYLVPPFLWTHFGPVGILGCVTGALSFVGLGVGIAIYGLTPDDGFATIREDRLPVAVLTTVAALAGAAAIYFLWLVPRYQMGQDLRNMLALTKGAVEARTIVWLDGSRPPHHEPALESWSTSDNIQRLGRWIHDAPWPSAQTKPAAVVLGNRALWDWNPDQALHWLDVQRRRQPHDSNLNAAMAEVLRATMPDAARSDLAWAFTDGNRFAWPGAASQLQVAVLLHRTGREAESRSWAARSAELLPTLEDDELRRALEERPPSGEITGRLLLDGRPLTGARVALFHTFDESPEGTPSLIDLARQAVDRQPLLVTNENDWKPSHHYYMNLRSLRAFYGVVTTDSAGSFRFAPLDRGRYLLAVQLTGTLQVAMEGGAGFPLLLPARMKVDLGSIHLESIASR